MIGYSTALFQILVVWCCQFRISTAYSYELKAHVTFRNENYDYEYNSDLIVGVFTNYGKQGTEKSKGRVILADETYGCQGSNTTLQGASGAFIVVLPLSECNDYLRSKKAEKDKAVGVVFYYTSNTKKDWSSEGDDLSIPVAVIGVSDEALGHITGRVVPVYSAVTIEGRLYPVVPQQRTFYFIVTAFCILILLSCLWFFTSYFKRCKYSWRNRRRQAREESTARKAISKLKVRYYRTSKGSMETESCAVCLDLYSNNDVIRVLPCRHEFHKNCVDPWLKLKHTCPLCKYNITTTEESQTIAHNETTVTVNMTTSPPLSPSRNSLTSSTSGDSSSSANSSTVVELQEMRLLTTSASELAITLEEEVEDNISPDTQIV